MATPEARNLTSRKNPERAACAFHVEMDEALIL
jgi:hypothetical protein